MRESLFVKQNAGKWKEFEQHESSDPDEIARLFITITDDLAYAKTFFPKSKTTAYLNGLASRFHQNIYKNKKEQSARFSNFWKTELPLLFFRYRRSMLYSLLFFLVFCLVGALSARYDDKFIRVILSDEYVNMTNENIAKGDPFAVYKQQGEFLMFVTIAANNIFVSFITFIMGVFFSVGSVLSLVRNGIMLGSFEYYFFSKGFGMQSVLVIWIHGVLEISAIVIAGGAGLVLGNSLLFPKTYTRALSFKLAAKDGLKIVIGLMPIFLIAAFFEGFVTRHTEMPWWLSTLILASSLLFIIWYVVLYPLSLSREIRTSCQRINA